jgi:hypothetical protein
VANPSKQKGTAFETATVKRYNDAGIEATRAANHKASWDIFVPEWPAVPIECKRRVGVLSVPEWVRGVQAVSVNGHWVLHVHQGDGRKAGALGKFVALDEDFYFHLIDPTVSWRETDAILRSAA